MSLNFIIPPTFRNSKIQAPNYKQIPTSNFSNPKLKMLLLEFEIWNLFEFWDLELGILIII